MISRLVLAFTLTMASFSALAAEPTEAEFKARIKQLAIEFVLDSNNSQQIDSSGVLNPRIAQLLNTPDRWDDDECRDRPPRGPSCVDAACSRMSKSSCDDLHEINAVAEACRGNDDGICLGQACSRMSQSNCDDLHEIRAVAEMCRGNFRGDCLQAFCSRMSQSNCDDLHEIKAVATSCEGLSRRTVACIGSVCSRMSQSNCDDLHEIQAVARSCAGRDDNP